MSWWKTARQTFLLLLELQSGETIRSSLFSPHRHRRGSAFLQVKVTSAGEAGGEQQRGGVGGEKKTPGEQNTASASKQHALPPPSALPLPSSTLLFQLLFLSTFYFISISPHVKQPEMRSGSPLTDCGDNKKRKHPEYPQLT